MKLIHLSIFAILVATAVTTFGETQKEVTLKKIIELRLSEKIESVTETPYSGLFEIRTDRGNILYSDKDAQYLFMGHVVNATTHEDYTKSRLDSLNKINFADLPLDSALKMVRGDGKQIIAIFEDPNCSYCKQFRRTLKDVDNITVYTFMYNILAKDSFVKSKNVWCSADPAKAWDDWMLNGNATVMAPLSCLTTPNDMVLGLGRKLKIMGIPTILFKDGSRISGAIDAKKLEAKLSSIKYSFEMDEPTN